MRRRPPVEKGGHEREGLGAIEQKARLAQLAEEARDHAAPGPAQA